MAAAAPSPLASSVEKTNGAKLSRLLIDGGTTVLRTIFDRFHPPANLLADLNANYLTLDNLLRRRVLHRPQWDLLFPPGGATPDSNTFDITLLFLLLTNICGLSPPPTGWHACPPPSDTSLEANLARIKFFRNELYGHVTTTGVDTPTFCALWLEISAVLVALGLNQAEIDRLKAERCGEEDYIDVLLEWADSEEDIKSQLKDIRQSQTNVQQTVHKVHHSQLENRTILQYSKGTREELHKFQAITQETIDKVRQRQLEDRETVREIYQIDRKAYQVVTDVRQTQIDDRKANQQMRQTTEQGFSRFHDRQREVHKTLQEKIEEVSQSHKELLRTQGQFRQKKETLERELEKRREDEILKKLAKIGSMRDVRRHIDRYVDGTRLSIFAEVESWLDDKSSPNRVIVICGNSGIGKSVIAAVTCQRMLEAGRLAGSHFCQHDRAPHRNPKVMLQSLARHLAESLPHYKKALVQKISRNLSVEMNDMEVKDLFGLLFEEPLTSLTDPGQTYLVVIDGIQESEYQGRNEPLDVIADYFKKLPSWIRFLVTTRPEINIADRLKCLHPLLLEPNNEENLKDIYICFEKQLSHIVETDYQESILQELVRKSEGVMLYTHYLVDFIKENVSFLTFDLLDKTLPSGISSVYHSYFKRLETDLRGELNVTADRFLTFLSAVAAAREPLPLGFVCKLLLSDKSPSALQRKVITAISCVSALLPLQGERIRFFHKSVKDWLTEKSKNREHYFSVDERGGHHVLSKLCIDELDDIKRQGVDIAQFSDTTKYALEHGVQHMLQLEEEARVCSLEDVVTKYVLDLELVYAKLCVNVTAASKDIICIQKQKGTRALFEKYYQDFTTLLFLLRTHISTLPELPHVIFQTLLNEGGPELSSKALDFLETRYVDIPYMEYLHKKNLHTGSVQARFHCSDRVACFDVSQALDYLVCECEDDTIQLWSLHYGKLLWKRPVAVAKLYYSWYDAYRRSPSSSLSSSYFHFFPTSAMSFYRSVVFHPTEDLVLPGILSHAYTIDGEWKPLFPSSDCRFSVCSISGDKSMMLTDCLENDKCIIKWSLVDGSEISRFTSSKLILSFAWSHDGRLLAICHSTGSICLVDAINGFTLLAETDTSEVCGMIKFSSDCQFLFCGHLQVLSQNRRVFRLNINIDSHQNFSLDVSPEEVFFEPWEFESRSENGFLLGDPFCFAYYSERGKMEGAFAFVFSKQSLLWSSPGSADIDILYLDVLTKQKEVSTTTVKNAVFSLNGETVYVVSDATPTTIMAWDVSSGELKAEVSTGINPNCRLVAVRGGVLFTTSSGTLEMWNCALSECMRRFSDSEQIKQVIAISEERVALGRGNMVRVLDTTTGYIVSTLKPANGDFIACNSKCQLIIFLLGALVLWDGKTVLWKKAWRHSGSSFESPAMFSPTELFLVIPGKLPPEHRCKDALFFLDAVSGRTLHMIRRSEERFDCKFISDEAYVVTSDVRSRGCCLRLFSVKTGDLLSVIPMGIIPLEQGLYYLATCPRKRLVATGLREFNHSFKIIQVSFPQDKDSRNNKRSDII